MHRPILFGFVFFKAIKKLKLLRIYYKMHCSSSLILSDSIKGKQLEILEWVGKSAGGLIGTQRGKLTSQGVRRGHLKVLQWEEILLDVLAGGLIGTQRRKLTSLGVWVGQLEAQE